MEVIVENAEGIPKGSVLSIRAGNVRRQGTFPAEKPVQFSTTSPLQASPFKVDILAPVASARLTLKPNSERYVVPLESETTGPMRLDLFVKNLNEESSAPELGDEVKQQKKQNAINETQAYMDEHQLLPFVQNLMASVLAEKPVDPFLYLEQQLKAVRAEKGSMPPTTPAKQAEKPGLQVSIPEDSAAVVPTRVRRAHNQSTKQVLLAPHVKDFMGPAFIKEDPAGAILENRLLALADLMQSGAQVQQLKIRSLQERSLSQNVASPLCETTTGFIQDEAMVTTTISFQGTPTAVFQMPRAGPRKFLHFNPRDVVATVVICGGLCPGLNAVVRELVMMLSSYGVGKIWGVMGGHNGVVKPEGWLELTPESVQDIHNLGGAILVCDRGSPSEEEQVQALMQQGVRVHFVIGDDGAHLAALSLHEKMTSLSWDCAVVAIPKTIDNSFPMLDRTFGFDTACTEAARAINAAYVEAKSNANCMGLVKLMGCHCGFIAQNACLAARHVDIVLLPEMQISLDKVLQHCLHLMQSKGHAVVVVAEGCRSTLLNDPGEVDADGNSLHADVGLWLREKIDARFKEVKLPLTIKYIDPTYMIRAVAPNANDKVYCSVLAHNAVHAAMAGFTGLTLGQVHQRFVMLPLECVTKLSLKRVDLKGRWFMELVSTTKQPDFSPDGVGCSPPTQEPAKGNPLEGCTNLVDVASCLGPTTEIRRLELEHLSQKFADKAFATTLDVSIEGADRGFIGCDSWVTQTLGGEGVSLQMLKAGPRSHLHFRPSDVAATIVTCGGLCPGLNSVIRELVMMLYSYGVKKVYGIKGGYKGVVNPQSWLTLTPENVQDIHMQGGSILVSDRGNPPHIEMAKVLRRKGVRQHFVLGGDGTQKGAYQTYEQMQNIDWECAVVGIPKTIDNDINLLDRSFGFDTAMAAAEDAIDVAYVEATCNANCVGLVKLMGRHCGYLTMMSVLAARHVDICLLPEMDIEVDKVLEQCVNLLNLKNHAVIVVAEGCGDTLIQSSGETDAGGNKKISDVGIWLKDQITAHFKELHLPVTIKYVDPTYMVRAIPANANDSIYCSMLAQGAVHAAMAGYTGVTVGKVDSSVVYLPIKMLTSMPSRTVDINGPWFERLLATTGQPHFGAQGTLLAKPIDPGKVLATPSSTARWSVSKGKNTGALLEQAARDGVRVPETYMTIIDGYGNKQETRVLQRSDLIQETSEIRELPCFHLSNRFGKFNLPSPLKGKWTRLFQDNMSWTTQAMYLGDRVDSGQGLPFLKFTRAGPRASLHFDPNDPAASAAIVSCGGICPGLNSVIREIVMTLWTYGVRKIWGVRGGYKGVMEPENWIQLTPDLVKDIHLSGGTMLISDRGNPPHPEMAKMLQSKGVRQYFVLGGDGTHKGAMQTFDCCLEIDHECAVIGVPKTIDNDVPLFDQTFGFDTACTEAEKAVDSAYVEACCNANCIGLVKLMGRHCGFIAMNAAIAAGHVDICLLPEMDIDLEKLLKHVEVLMESKRYAVIVVAEGCGDTLIESTGAKDAGGNKVLADVGVWLKDTITARFKQLGRPLTIKYIDPTYMIRSVPANCFDSAYCSVLGQNAVHGAMAGYSGVTVGKVYEQYVYAPIHAITQQEGKRVNPKGRWFARLVQTTKQPDFAPSSLPLRGPSNNSNVLDVLSHPRSINDILQRGDAVHRLQVVNVGDKFPSVKVPNPLMAVRRVCLTGDAWSTQTFSRENKRDDRGHLYFQMLRSGPRGELHFDPGKSAALLVTCGGLCPGLNSVIREIVMTLDRYGVNTIYGCVGGYKGMVEPDKWITLKPEVVQDIHMQGGTILVSDRGNPPHIEIAKTLQRKGITQYFVIGGDGTQAGAFDTFTCTQQIGHEVAVVGVPKTIDNDIPILDRSFGFNTACSEAESAIDSAYVESTSIPNCIGLVKLMGRHCGFIAMHATLAARSVDMCLLPEMAISLPRVLTHALHCIKTNGHAVIVVAEGCGDTLLQSSGEQDAGGNKKLADVGPWLKEQLQSHFRKMCVPLNIKYIDPTYTIRAVPANANDSVYCTLLAQQAVHNAMAGYTGIVVGKVDERYVMLPTHAITKTPARRVDLNGRHFMNMKATTGQPDLAPGPGDEWALLPPPPSKFGESLFVRQATPTLTWPATPAASECTALVTRSMPGVQKLARRPTLQAKSMPPTDVILKVLDGFGAVAQERQFLREDVIRQNDEVRKLGVVQLGDIFGKKTFPSRLQRRSTLDQQQIEPSAPTLRKDFLDNESWVVEAIASEERVDSGSNRPFYQMLRAGPRQHSHFEVNEAESCAAIVTCGGLCPGVNVVIRELVSMLMRYGVQKIYGIRNGFYGIPDVASWLELTREVVQEIHMKGGSILRSERGNPPIEEMANALQQRRVRQLFMIGGDGSHKALQQILNRLLDVGHECAVVGLPSTVNNDISMVDTCFGFDTVCTEARDSIDAAYVEATCNANCIGLVKLLGRNSGFLTLTATLASRHVDICLLQEMEISLEKVLDHCEHLMSSKGYMVMVVAEGCAASLTKGFESEPENVDIGPWLRDKVLARFKEKQKPLTVKYIDPTYSVRSVPPNAFDSVYCSSLAEHAVHGAMAGYTGIATVKVYEKYVYLPIGAVQRRRVNPNGRWIGRMRFTTQQPNFEPDGFTYPASIDNENSRAVRNELAQAVPIGDVLPPGSEICRLECTNLSSKFTSRKLDNPLQLGLREQAKQMFVSDASWTVQVFQRRNAEDSSVRKYFQMLRSGPHAKIHFDPKEPGAAAAIVTCGGLCPGLNSVIREVVKMLRLYGVQKVYGIIGGFKGCVKDDDWIELTDKSVQDIHMRGGSVLVSDRGNPPHSEIAQVLHRRNIRQYFVLGGDGTHKGASQSFQAMTEIGHECAVVGVPKTIDNDITMVDQTFGFDTACTEARKAIDSAYVEATTNANCIGLVKLMGRHCGWIAANASIAARYVDVCLIPEMNVSLQKLLEHVVHVMRRKQYAVIVVAEGCGDTILSGTGETDAGGNKLLADVGPYLKEQLTTHFKKEGLPLTIKYIDPTYMIRAVPANAYDSLYCSVLAQQAVHAAMAGYTGVSVGKVDERYVTLPIHAIVDKEPRRVNRDGPTYERLIATTGQPSFEP